MLTIAWMKIRQHNKRTDSSPMPSVGAGVCAIRAKANDHMGVPGSSGMRLYPDHKGLNATEINFFLAIE